MKCMLIRCALILLHLAAWLSMTSYVARNWVALSGVCGRMGARVERGEDHAAWWTRCRPGPQQCLHDGLLTAWSAICPDPTKTGMEASIVFKKQGAPSSGELLLQRSCEAEGSCEVLKLLSSASR